MDSAPTYLATIFSPLSTLYKLSHCILAVIISYENPAAYFIGIPFSMMICFSLDVFKISSLFGVLSFVIQFAHGVLIFILIAVL